MKIFGSLTQEKFDYEKEIATRRAKLDDVMIRLGLRRCASWPGYKIKLEQEALEAVDRIITLALDPVENRNLIVAESAKRSRDLARIREVDDSEREYAQLVSEIETLTQLSQVAKESADKKRRRFGVVK